MEESEKGQRYDMHPRNLGNGVNHLISTLKTLFVPNIILFQGTIGPWPRRTTFVWNALGWGFPGGFGPGLFLDWLS